MNLERSRRLLSMFVGFSCYSRLQQCHRCKATLPQTAAVVNILCTFSTYASEPPKQIDHLHLFVPPACPPGEHQRGHQEAGGSHGLRRRLAPLPRPPLPEEEGKKEGSVGAGCL